MKVSLDLSPLYSAHQFRGIGFYTQRLIKGIQQLVKEKEIDLELELIKSTNKLQFLETDIIHYPYFSPFFLSLPSRPLSKSLVTIHDLIPIKHSSHFPAGVKGKARWLIQKRRLKKVDAVITDSNYWREEIPGLTGFDQTKINVVPLAAGEEFKLIKSKSKLDSVARSYQLPSQFILYVGDVNWNKNLSSLLKSFSQLKKKGNNLKLVLVGKAFTKKDLPETKALLGLIKSLNLEKQIKILGFLPTPDLVAVYNLAKVYCQLSFSEGFGLPVLEAMASGCPVVVAKTSSLTEVAGSAAVLVDPYDINSIVKGIVQAQNEEVKLQKQGLKRSQQYSWLKTARQTVDVYKKVYQEKA